MGLDPLGPVTISVAVPGAPFATTLARASDLIGSPTFVDDGRWAQLDLGGFRLSVGTPDEVVAPTLLVRVADVAAASASLRQRGWEVGEPAAGPHERRADAGALGGLAVVLYEPLTSTSEVITS